MAAVRRSEKSGSRPSAQSGSRSDPKLGAVTGPVPTSSPKTASSASPQPLPNQGKRPVDGTVPGVAAESASEREKRQAAEEQRSILQKATKEAAKEAARKAAASEAAHGHKTTALPEEPVIKARKPKRKPKPLKDILALAGISEEPIAIARRVVKIGILVMLLVTVFTTVLAIGWSDTFASRDGGLAYVGFLAAMWTVGLAATILLTAGCYAFYIDLRINQRRKEIETVFPDYLQLAAANLAAGMTIDRALWSAVRPRFGVLAKEMEDVAKKTMTGRDLERSLQEFGNKYDSVVIKRAVDLICEGTRSGGRMADILNKIAVNMQENAILQKEMSANVTTYVIFISFASVLASPFLFGLATQLLAVIQGIAGSLALDSGSSGSVGLSISSNAVDMADFRLFSIIVLGITSVMSACIVSVIRKGNVRDGIKSIPVYFAVSVVLYFIATWALGYLFGGFFAN